jgi:hypothetical protein
MPSSLSARRKPPRTPPGCEGHLTRQQAAELLGFSSEFKIRQLEREGRLRSVRGPMRTAFYARVEVLAVKAELEQASPGRCAEDDWTDAELLVLLRHPNREGRARTALDLVLETHISIDRAEKVCAFWTGCGGPGSAAAAAPKAPVPIQTSAAAVKAASTPSSITSRTDATVAPPPVTASPEPEGSPHEVDAGCETVPLRRAPALPPEPSLEPQAKIVPAQAASPPERPVEASADERRGEERLSRDALIEKLRHPDPRVRERAFARLKEQSVD